MINPADDTQGVIPDGQAPMGQDASDDAALESDSQLDGKSAIDDGDGDEGDSGMDMIKQLLDYGRKKNGLTDGNVETAGNIPAVPAGPGGDQTQPNPFGTRTAQVPFGKRYDDGGTVDPDEDNRYPELNAIRAAGRAIQGAIPENVDPNVDRASNVGNRQINDMADSAASKVRNLLPSVGAPNAPDRASQVGQRQITDMADSAAGDAGSALKSGAQTVSGALAAQGNADANTAMSTADPDGITEAVGALKSAAGQAGSAVSDAVGSLNQQPQGEDPAKQVGGAIQDQLQQFPGNAKRIMSYLMGDAAHSTEVTKAEQAVDPQGQMPESDRKKAAIEAAAQSGGPEAGWRLLQANRQRYEALRHSAAAVADSGDLEQAAQLATKAYGHVPDGSDIHFTAGQNGVTAKVTEGDKVLANVQMTPQQFRQYLTSPDGQFDNALETSPAVGIQKAANAIPFAPAAAQNGGMGATPGQASVMPRLDGQPSLRKQPSVAQAQPGGAGGGGTPLEQNTMEKAEAVARRLFPRVSQEAQRTAYVENIMSKGGQQYPSAETQATEKGALATERARIAGGSRERVAQIGATSRENVQQGRTAGYDRRTQAIIADNALKAATSSQNATQANAMRMISTIIRDPMNGGIEKAEAFAKQHGINIDQLSQGGAAPAPAPASGAAAPAAGAQPKHVNSAADYEALTPGEAYIDPKGVRKIKGR